MYYVKNIKNKYQQLYLLYFNNNQFKNNIKNFLNLLNLSKN